MTTNNRARRKAVEKQRCLSDARSEFAVFRTRLTPREDYLFSAEMVGGETGLGTMPAQAKSPAARKSFWVFSSHPGFTLIELLLYISLSAFMLFSVFFFLSVVLRSRVQNQTIAEVEQEGLRAMQVMSQVIRNAENIVSPAPGTSAAVSSLDVVDAAKDPTVFDAFGGVIRVAEGGSPAVTLTSSRVAVSDLSFDNVSGPGTPGILRIRFTLTHVNYSKTFYGSASLR